MKIMDSELNYYLFGR